MLWTAVAFALLAAAIVPLFHLWGERTRRNLSVLSEPDQQEAQGGVLIVLEPSRRQVAPLPRTVERALLTLAALQVSALGELAAVDPFQTEELLGEGGGLDRALLVTDPACLLRIGYRAGPERRRWSLSFSSLRRDGWTLQRDSSPAGPHAGDLAVVGRMLDGLLAEAAERLDVEGYEPFLSTVGDGWEDSGEGWARLGTALSAERQGRWAEARAALRDASGGGAPQPVLSALDAFYAMAAAWEEGRSPAPGEMAPEGDARGEFAHLARATAGIGAGRSDARRALAGYLTAYPRSKRAHYLLAIWRSLSAAPPDDVMAAAWRAVELDTGYMPAARAAARVSASRSPDGPAAVMERYRSLSPADQDLARLQRYCDSLRPEGEPHEGRGVPGRPQ